MADDPRGREGTTIEPVAPIQALANGFTPRAIAISTVGLLLTGFITVKTLFSLGPFVDFSIMPSAPAFLFLFIMVALNGIVRWMGRKDFVTAAEMVTVYAIVGIGALLQSHDVFWYIVGSITSLNMRVLFDEPERFAEWADIIVFSRPDWALVTGDALLGFYEGGADAIPWGAWVGPAFAYLMYYFAVYWVLLCLATLVRKNFSQVQNYHYPLAIPPIEVITASAKPETTRPFWTNRMLVMGALLPFAIGIYNHISGFYPALTPIAYAWSFSNVDFGGPGTPGHTFFRTFHTLEINWTPAWIGILYFVHMDLLMSFWVFFLALERFPRVIYEATGLTGIEGGFGEGWRREQGIGAVLVFGAMTLWMCRAQIRAAFEKAMRRPGSEAVDDSNEAMSYPMAFWGTVGGVIFLLLWSHFVTGLGFHYAVIFFPMLFVSYVAYMRFRAETGIPQPAALPIDIGRDGVSRIVGFNYVGPQSHVINIANNYGLSRTIGGAGAFFLEAYEMADSVGQSRRSLNKAFLFAFPVALLLAMMMMIPDGYEFGLDQGQTRGINVSRNSALNHAAARWIEGPDAPVAPEYTFAGQIWATTYIGVGALMMAGLFYLRMMFTWFPFHPAAYPLVMWAYTPGPAHFWFAFFAAWLIKFGILRYGGQRLFTYLKPFFIGLIIGSAADMVITIIIGQAVEGSYTFWLG